MFPTTSSPHSHVFVLRTADRHTLAAHRNSGKHRQVAKKEINRVIEYPGGTVLQTMRKFLKHYFSQTHMIHHSFVFLTEAFAVYG